ncbi:Rv2231c family pyridoxal phosphate-dependent protein CobC [Streptomyces celluloflavus]|uniref:Rv2231c family pyridoxal phosphate-dependent protein CobC n=1 Tax=Streptomyces celluloflavus TaxID=58344 RepID=UPI00346002C6|nr:Rv2231c family pyridoxal phosphate-dependent protein CobC [Streptomyces celluloflavus]
MTAEPAAGPPPATADATAPPPSLVAGVGASCGVPVAEVLDLVAATLARAGYASRAVTALATVAARAAEPGLVGAARRLGVPLRSYPAEALAAVPVPAPSGAARAAVGTPSVAEAAALLAAGPGAELLIGKRKSAPPGRAARATCALAAAGTGTALPALADGHIPTATDSVPATSDPIPAATDPIPAAPDRIPAATDRIPAATGLPHEPDLRHHGDAEVRGAHGELTDLTDLAVNVRTGTPPAWLKAVIAASLDGLAAYPDGRAARRAVAARHGLPVDRVLLTSGAAEAFVLIARAVQARRPVVVHPQFTEPEAALRDAGHTVERVLLDERDGFRLDPAAVPADADLVIVGNPTNPTSVLHPAGTLAQLARPGRTLVVDEAFMDAVPGERASLAGRTDLPGLVVLRSLTKTWGLAGLRIGYVLAAPGTVAELTRAQPLWPVSAPALAAAEACCTPAALAEAAAAAGQIAADRAHLLARLGEFTGIRAVPAAEGPFVLIRLAHAAAVREGLRTRGFAVRRGDTFPGLGPDWLRLAVRGRSTTDRFVAALAGVLESGPAAVSDGGRGGGPVD